MSSNGTENGRGNGAGADARVEPDIQQGRKSIPTLVKNDNLVREKRGQIVEAAVELFVRKGFHQTTTREIARAAGFSIGTLYEYIESKEDVLYLVCDAIHGEIESGLRAELAESGTARDRLERAIASYMHVCDRLQEWILLIYRDTASLADDSQRYVLSNEARITGIFEGILREGIDSGVFELGDSLPGEEAADPERLVQLTAHNIMVLGHMWCFRRWFLRGQFTIDEFITHQTSLLMRELTGEERATA